MTCEECEQILLDQRNFARTRGWMPGVSALNLANAHAQNCSACAAKMSEIRNLHDALDKLRLSTICADVPAVIATNLLVSFRERTKSQASPVASNLAWRLVWGVSVSFALLAIGIMLHSAASPRRPVRHISEVEARAQSVGEHPALRNPITASDARPDRVRVENNGFNDALSKAARSMAVRAKVHPPIRTQEKQPFSMEGRDDWALNGGGSVVRVTLPLSNLVAVGIPVHPDISDPRVTADVIIDPFGSVMAIRLVEAKSTVN